MWALAGAAAIAVISGLMQHYQSEKARKASSKRLKEIEEMFDAVVPPEFDLKVYDDPSLAADIPAPAVNMEKITPELYQKVGQYVPVVADFVREANPELVKATEEAKVGRQAQMDALERYRKIASGEFDPEFAAQMDAASSKARRDAKSVQDSILQDAQARGQFGSGMMLASQMQRSSDAMARQAIESRMAAAEAYRNKLSALDKSADLGGQIRRSEMDEQARNVGIINDFNERTSRNYQDYLWNRTNTLNNAKLRNLSEEQRIADLNTGLENKARIDQVERYNRGQEALYNAARDNRANRLDLLSRKERLKQLMYDNLMSKARGKAGIGETEIKMIQDNAMDRNRTTQGIANAGMTTGLAYYDNESRRNDQKYRPDYSYQSAPKQRNPYGYDDEDEFMVG